MAAAPDQRLGRCSPISGSGSVESPARSRAGAIASLVRRSSVARTRILRLVLARRSSCVGDATEEHLAENLALVGLDPERLERVLRREDLLDPARVPSPLLGGVSVSVMQPTLSLRRDGARALFWAVGSVRGAMATVLLPIPACDFDPTEVAVSWQVLSAAGHDVVFATPVGPGRPRPTTSW